MDIETIRTLRNGVRIPSIGFGTYKAPDDSTGIHAIREAINAGYRLIDTATLYGNEQALGKAVKESGIPREDLFLTTKVANSDRGYDSTLRAFDTSLQLLDTDYIDLYLIHWPASKVKSADWEQINSETWRALERLLEEKRVRAIGVSNFMPEHLEALTKTSHVMPMVNQIEFHPGWIQPETLSWCNANDVIVEAWSPLGRTRLFDNPLLKKLSEKYDKSVAQICLRWELQKGVIPIPKSLRPERMSENIDVFDFSLSDEDMLLIDRMPPTGESGLSPDNINF